MYKYFKRIVDFMIALVAIAVLFFPLVIVAILIKIDSKGPVIFKQERLGKDGVPFKICISLIPTLGDNSQILKVDLQTILDITVFVSIAGALVC